jgi:hypothetical protein
MRAQIRMAAIRIKADYGRAIRWDADRIAVSYSAPTHAAAVAPSIGMKGAVL